MLKCHKEQFFTGIILFLVRVDIAWLVARKVFFVVSHWRLRVSGGLEFCCYAQGARDVSMYFISKTFQQRLFFFPYANALHLRCHCFVKSSKDGINFGFRLIQLHPSQRLVTWQVARSQLPTLLPYCIQSKRYVIYQFTGFRLQVFIEVCVLATSPSKSSRKLG